MRRGSDLQMRRPVSTIVSLRQTSKLQVFDQRLRSVDKQSPHADHSLHFGRKAVPLTVGCLQRMCLESERAFHQKCSESVLPSRLEPICYAKYNVRNIPWQGCLVDSESCVFFGTIVRHCRFERIPLSVWAVQTVRSGYIPSGS